jgi:cytochrome c peroxidase
MMNKPKATLIGMVLLIVGFKVADKTTPYQFPKLKFFPAMPTSPVNPVTVEGVDLGRHLFYDSILSLDRKMSCASCHKHEFAFSDAPNKFSKGSNEEMMQRNTMPLFNLAWYSSFFWDGKAKSIEEQVFHPVRAHNEMNLQWEEATKRIAGSKFYVEKFKQAFGEQPIDSMLVAKAIAQFERTLISNNSKFDQVIRGERYLNQDEKKGFELMNDMTKGDCFHCHSTDADALGTTLGFSNNGLDDIKDAMLYKDFGLGAVTGNASDNGKFKVPSLRNLAFTAPYMHDGRFETLDEVLDFYNQGVHPGVNVDSKMGSAQRGGVHLTDQEKQQIKIFLLSMTDSVFIRNPAYGNPFLQNQ